MIAPAGFKGFFEETGALGAQEQQDLPRVLEIAKQIVLELLPPRGA